MKRENFILIAIGAVTFSVMLLATAPASLIAWAVGPERLSVSYSNIEGTIWRGKLSDVHASGTAFGDVTYRVSPLSLLLLSPRTVLNLSGGAVVGSADISAGSNGRLHVRSAALNLDLEQLAPRGLFGSPVVGAADVTIDELLTTKTGCQKAKGAIWTDMLNAPARQFSQGDSFPMAGGLRCDGEKLVIVLEGEGDPGNAKFQLVVSPDYSYEIIATANPAHDNIASTLRYFGFEDDNGALTYGSVGVLRGAGS